MRQDDDPFRALNRALLALPSLLVALLLFLNGCAPVIGNVIDKRLAGDYYVVAVDEKEQLCVVYRGEAVSRVVLIPSVVVDVGWNDWYIVAATRSLGTPGGRLSYFYIDMRKPPSATDLFSGVTGPMDEEGFRRAEAALDLPDFTLHYPELR